MLSKIKEYLEDVYHIGFQIEGNINNFIISLLDSEFDKFSIKVVNKDGIRLNIKAEPEKHASGFIYLLSKSDSNKRSSFCTLWNSNVKGQINVHVNGRDLIPNDFINLKENWNDFNLVFSEFPFDNSFDELLRACSLLCGMMLSLVDFSIQGYEEGMVTSIHCSKYERNPINRKICLSVNGYKCAVCGFDFEEMYGKVGKDVIEVHHTTPVSEMGEGYIVNPLEDLVPVCSNCHTIIHKRKPPYTVEEVRKMLRYEKDRLD